MLALDVEFLTGTCYSAAGPHELAADWPPQPDRLFSAMVSIWASRGEHGTEKSALEWLEQQPPPLVRASAAHSRLAPPAFVPPNDVAGTSVEVLPWRRRRYERRFPAARPEDPVVTYSWPAANPGEPTVRSLQAIAHDMVYLGHSSSLVRCHFRVESSADANIGVVSRRCVYPGRLAELQLAFQGGRRASPGEAVSPEAPSPCLPPTSLFGRNWYVFADTGGGCPSLQTAALATRALRVAIMSGFRGRPVPEAICGHREDGRPTTLPHMAIFPLANVGWPWADGRLMGLAVALPRAVASADEHALHEALADIIRRRGSIERQEIHLKLPGGGLWRLARQADPNAHSLKPFRYLRDASTWSTATPIALDRHPKKRDNDEREHEVSELVADACERIGLPRPSRVIPHLHSAIRGSMSARGHSLPSWTNWALPESLRGRALTHATVHFDEAVRGPVALGAGRFVGLGLCLPIASEARA